MRAIPRYKESEGERNRRVTEEADSWGTVTVKHAEGKALYEAAEASGRDLAAEKASLQLLLRENGAKCCELLDKDLES